MEQQSITNVDDVAEEREDEERQEQSGSLLAGMGTNRIEAFSDGVFAIALTLLVLEIKVPSPADIANERALQVFLLNQWQTYLSYALSVVAIGIFWVAHRGLFHYIRRADRTLFWLNILFLLLVTFIPFPAALLGEFSTYRTSVIIYGATLAITGFLLDVIRAYATTSHRLIDKHLHLELIRTARRRNLTGPIIYLLGIIIALIPFNIFGFSGIQVCIALYALVPFLYILPGRIDNYWAGRRPQKVA